MKKMFNVVISLILVITSLLSNVLTVHAANEDVTLTIHYNRSSNDYENWNIWSWELDGEGSVIEPSTQDDFGLVFQREVNDESEYGFIIRKGDWEEKNCPDDQFIEINGDTEVWITEGSCDYSYESPSGTSTTDENTVEKVSVGDEATLYVHYFRFDENYTGWNLWTWVEGKYSNATTFEQNDDFGLVSKVDFTDLNGVDEVGLIVRLNEWEAKDVEEDRFVDLTKGQLVDGKLELHVYLVQGVSRIYYDIKDVDRTPSLSSAAWLTLDKIEVQSSAGIFDKEGFSVYHNDELINSTVSLVDGVAYLSLDEEVVMGDTYTVENENYKGSMDVGYTNLFSSDAFNDAFYYDGDDLGATYSIDSTSFRLWAPTAKKVVLNRYKTGDYREDDLIESLEMKKDVKGTWLLEVPGDLDKTYYTYTVSVGGKENEAVDPYATAVGVNGHRAMVINLEETSPVGFYDNRPDFSGNFVDAILYELHVRDLSSDQFSGIENVGKFLGVIEEGTTTPSGVPTGLDHMIDLGITHLHLLPAFDHRSIDETKLNVDQFNWGYDPYNFNVPEGSYSTDPYNGEVRVEEFKEMVHGLHNNDIRVVMDVVYNHTGASQDSHLNKIVPGYYYRTIGGSFSNGSGCGNETASERAMVRKYIVDSVVYWATEYQIDGFRFDLMALHDIETMNAVRAALDEVDPSIVIYGEGWTGGLSPLPDSKKALKVNVADMDGIAVFSDDMRDGIKGSVFNNNEPGWVNGNLNNATSVRFGIVGGVNHYGVKAYYPVDGPWQTVNYVSAHDNLSLWDKLEESTMATEEVRKEMQKISNAIVLTSQGVPFLHAGVEFLRSKDGDHNSYQSSDEVNQLEWLDKENNLDVYEYYKGLIELRKSHDDFRLNDSSRIAEELSFISTIRGIIAYTINDETVVGFNALNQEYELELPANKVYKIVVDKDQAGTETLGYAFGTVTMLPYSSYVLIDTTSSVLLVVSGILMLLIASFFVYRKLKK